VCVENNKYLSEVADKDVAAGWSSRLGNNTPKSQAAAHQAILLVGSTAFL